MQPLRLDRRLKLQYSIVGTDEGENLTVFTGTGAPLVAHSSHPNYERIVAGVKSNDESVIDLFNLSKFVSEKFDKLSERVSVKNGRLYFDGEVQDNSLAEQTVRFITEGQEDYKPLVKFFENVQQNPNEHSRTQLFDWLSQHDFTITDEGMVVGYKGVQSSDGENFLSTRSGRATVNGEVKTGCIPQKVGDVVEMPRGEVAHDPAEACHTGLHVGTYDFASDYNMGALLEVHVNPRDVVSVPTDAAGAKIRVCRYTVVGTLDAPYTTAVLFSDDYDESDEWGDNEFDEDEDQDLWDNTLGDGLDDEDDEEPVADLEENVRVGDVFEDTDPRDPGRTFTVESIEDGFAIGKSRNPKHDNKPLTRKVNVDRLTSYRYKKV